MLKKMLLICFVSAMALTNAQEKTITGVVSDSYNPLPGVSITIKGTTKGTTTNFDGVYSITANEGDVLVFSAIGFTTVKRRIKKQSIIDVVMKEDEATLEEVVVIGYGIANRKRSRKHTKTLSNSYVKRKPTPPSSRDSYATINETIFKRTTSQPLSTFSIDVDRASYSNIRRMINNGQRIPKDAVKIEELINYFDYNYPQPKDNHPFSITTEVITTPWNNETKLVRIGLKGKEYPQEDLPPSNLTFLIDVSGSMGDHNKLPLLKKAFKLLVNQLRKQDTVAIVVYAGAAGVVLEPTSGQHKDRILAALNNLEAGGSTAGGEGIELAYKLAEKHFKKKGNNRIILATDGDFNVGASSNTAMETLIEDKRKSGLFLSVLGFGYGNYQDDKLELLADKGNGNHAYIDTMQEAQKVFGKEFGGTLHTIAKDVKIQVEFNPKKVKAYRLIGYENRLLNAEDFEDNTKDAGELGSGHTVTALYEVIPIGVDSKYLKTLPKLKYTTPVISENYKDELLTVKFRYKHPKEKTSQELTSIVKDQINMASADMNFTCAVALFGMQLRRSKYSKNTKTKDIIALANKGKSYDKEGYRSEFIRLVKAYDD